METYDNNQIGNQQPVKRPGGMTFFLILSLINACFQIFSAIIGYLGAPMMKEMIETGQFEEVMAPFLSNINGEAMDAFMESLNITASINPTYYLFLFILYVGSLVGVLKMFKLDKIGFHIYSISQICILINASVFVYPLQAVSAFTSDLLSAILFILLYYLFFKRLEQINNGNQEGNI